MDRYLPANLFLCDMLMHAHTAALSNSAQLFTHEARVIYEQWYLWLLLLRTLGSYEGSIHLLFRPNLSRAAQQGYTKASLGTLLHICRPHLRAH